MKEFNLKLNEDDYSLLARAIFHTEKSPEEVLREALREYVEHLEQKREKNSEREV